MNFTHTYHDGFCACLDVEPTHHVMHTTEGWVFFYDAQNQPVETWPSIEDYLAHKDKQARLVRQQAEVDLLAWEKTLPPLPIFMGTFILPRDSRKPMKRVDQ